MGFSAKTLLVIDTIIGSGSISFWMNGGEIASRTLPDDAPQSETLLGSIDEMLRTALIDPDRVECLAVTVGPGSYTGIRVGIATALGIAVTKEIATIGVSTLAAIASAATGAVGLHRLAVLGIGGEDLIAQEFSFNGLKLESVSAPVIINISQLGEFRPCEIITDKKTLVKMESSGVKAAAAPENLAKLIGEGLVSGLIEGSYDDLTPVYSREVSIG